MPPMIHLLMLLFAFVCFVLASWSGAAPYWNRLVSGGLAFLVASMISW
jgi:hypothetical protein